MTSCLQQDLVGESPAFTGTPRPAHEADTPIRAPPHLPPFSRLSHMGTVGPQGNAFQTKGCGAGSQVFSGVVWCSRRTHTLLTPALPTAVLNVLTTTQNHACACGAVRLCGPQSSLVFPGPQPPPTSPQPVLPTWRRASQPVWVLLRGRHRWTLPAHQRSYSRREKGASRARGALVRVIGGLAYDARLGPLLVV